MKQFIYLVVLLGITACSLPSNQLTAEEREADMKWAFSVFKHNYAPADLKKVNFGVDMAQVEADCVAQASQDMDNPTFLALFQKCIHMFRDAHVGGQQMNNGILPEYATLAHLGFLTLRTKANLRPEDVNSPMIDALRIVQALNGSSGPTAPLVPGDIIIEVNGLAVNDYLQAEIVPYINVGQAETNLSIAALRFGVRTSTDMALPIDSDVSLRVLRNGQTFDIVIPWIVEDLLDFQLAQQPPQSTNSEEVPEELQEALEEIEDRGALVSVKQNPLSQAFFGYNELKKLFNFLETPVAMVTDRVKLIALHGFRWAQFNPILNSLLGSEVNPSQGAASDLSRRIFPMAEMVEDLMVDPLFTAKLITTSTQQRYAYIQIGSFPADDVFLGEWFRAITAIEDKAVKSLIIDMVDNNGGSLVHGMRMLNMTRKDLVMRYPSIQARLNNNWMNTFKTQAAFGVDAYQKAIGQRMVNDFKQDMQAGLSLSRPFPVTVLDPFFLQNPGYGVAADVEIALLVNEFCISMCDIFASVFQENHMGVVVGQTTMGGGGNVAQHGLSPIAKIGMALTESLIISADGKIIEDNGVTPDIQVDMVADRENGFIKAMDEALKVILPTATPVPTPIVE